MMNRTAGNAAFSFRRAGQAQVEYVLILAAFALPMFALFGLLLNLLSAHYGMVTFLETLPVP